MVCDGAEQNTNAITDSGTVTAGGSYASNTDCRWRLTCSDANLVPKLTFTSFETEDNDFVKIYDGSEVSSDTPLLAALSGDTLPDPISASGPVLTIQLTSDDSDNGNFNSGAVRDCCWSALGDQTTACGGYPTGSSGAGRCNTDWTQACSAKSDCPTTPVPPGGFDASFECITSESSSSLFENRKISARPPAGRQMKQADGRLPACLG
jgi:hypothetical protein